VLYSSFCSHTEFVATLVNYQPSAKEIPDRSGYVQENALISIQVNTFKREVVVPKPRRIPLYTVVRQLQVYLPYAPSARRSFDLREG